MWGGRESMTWNYNGDQDDDLADDQKEGEASLSMKMMLMTSLVHCWQRQGWERLHFCTLSGRPESLL